MLLLPLSVEHLDSNARLGFNLGHQQLLQLRCQFARAATVGARFGVQGGKAAFLMSIPPVLQRAHSYRLAGAIRRSQRRGRGDLLQGDFERHLLGQKLLDSADETKTRQGHGLGPIGRGV